MEAASVGGRLLGGVSEAMVLEAERRIGLRCTGCGERIRVGFKGVRLYATAPVTGERPSVEAQVSFACTRDECSYRDEMAEKVDALQVIEWAYPGDRPTPEKDEPEGGA